MARLIDIFLADVHFSLSQRILGGPIGLRQNGLLRLIMWCHLNGKGCILQLFLHGFMNEHQCLI